MSRRPSDKDGKKFGALLGAGAPWRIQALCVGCGAEHWTFTWNARRKDYTGPLFRLGICKACGAAEQRADEAAGAPVAPPKQAVPSLEEIEQKELARPKQRDVFDPFDERRDLK